MPYVYIDRTRSVRWEDTSYQPRDEEYVSETYTPYPEEVQAEGDFDRITALETRLAAIEARIAVLAGGAGG